MAIRPSATTLKPEMTDEELSAIAQWIRSAELKGRHLEVGTAAGGTLCFLMNCYATEGRPKFSVVDTMAYFPNQSEIVKENLAKHGLQPNDVDFRVSTSQGAFTQADAAGERFSFILVDASHKIRHVMTDLRWLGLLEVGGLACFHDYGTKFKGVTWPLDRLLRRHSQFTRLGQAGSLLCLRRNRESSRREVGWMDQLWALAWSPILQWDLSWRKHMARRQVV